jgi:hypothetical protein
VREGLGPCTFCGAPLLTSAEVQELIRELRDERGRERQAQHNDAQRRADSSRAAPLYSRPRTGPGVALGPTPAEEAARAAALAHRDRLLGFQADNAQRTTIRDEAADFDVALARGVGGGGAVMWGTKEERARELRRQQEILREMEWNDKPEWEKRTQVVSIDVVGGKVVKKMARLEMPAAAAAVAGPSSSSRASSAEPPAERRAGEAGGAPTPASTSNNPLRGALIRPTYGTGTAGEADAEAAGGRGSSVGVRRGWSRVQDFDGGSDGAAGGGGPEAAVAAAVGAAEGRGDEPDCG